MRSDFPGFLDRVPPLGDLVNSVAGAAENRPKQGAVRRAIIDDQDGAHHIDLLCIRCMIRFDQTQPVVPRPMRNRLRRETLDQWTAADSGRPALSNTRHRSSYRYNTF